MKPVDHIQHQCAASVQRVVAAAFNVLLKSLICGALRLLANKASGKKVKQLSVFCKVETKLSDDL